MAKVTGFQCDVCSKVEQTDNASAPTNWMRLSVNTAFDRTVDGWDICSNKCLAKLAKERNGGTPIKKGREIDVMFDETQKSFIRDYIADRGITGKAYGTRMGSHSRYHTDTLNADCLVCEAISDANFPSKQDKEVMV